MGLGVRGILGLGVGDWGVGVGGLGGRGWGWGLRNGSRGWGLGVGPRRARPGLAGLGPESCGGWEPDLDSAPPSDSQVEKQR